MEMSPDSEEGLGRQLEATKASAKAVRPIHLNRLGKVILKSSKPPSHRPTLGVSRAFHCGGVFRLYHTERILPTNSLAAGLWPLNSKLDAGFQGTATKHCLLYTSDAADERSSV